MDDSTIITGVSLYVLHQVRLALSIVQHCGELRYGTANTDPAISRRGVVFTQNIQHIILFSLLLRRLEKKCSKNIKIQHWYNR